ncbi:hypothetical protein ACFO4L_08100, partial [Bacillus daqingensis]
PEGVSRNQTLVPGRHPLFLRSSIFPNALLLPPETEPSIIYLFPDKLVEKKIDQSGRQQYTKEKYGRPIWSREEKQRCE